MTTALRTSTQYLGSVPLEVAYEYDPGEPAGSPGSNWDGPGTPPSVTIIGAYIISKSGHGARVDADEFSAGTVERWREAIEQEYAE